MIYLIKNNDFPIGIGVSIFFFANISNVQSQQNSSVSNMDAKQLLKQISSKFDSKNFQDALVDSEKLIKLEPNNGYNYITRGNIKEKLGDITGSVDDLKKGIEKDPKNKDYLSILAISYFKRNKYEDAIVAYSKVIEVDSKNIAAYQMRGNCFSKLGNKQAALDDYSQVIKLESNKPIGYILRGRTLAEMNKFDQAAKDLELASQNNYSESHTKALIHGTIGNIYKKFNHPQDAARHLRTTLELYKQSKDPSDTSKIQSLQKEIQELESIK